MKVTLVRARAVDPSVNKVARTLSDHGYDVRLLVWDRQNNLSDKDGNGYSLCRFTLRAPYDRPSAVLRLPVWWAYEFCFLMRERSDVVHACDLDTLIPAILVRLLKRVRLCYTIYDFYANNLADGRFQLVRRAVRSVVARVEKLGIRFADCLFLVDRSRYEEVRGAHINKLVYIYNSPPDCSEANLGQEPQPGGELVVLYAGLLTEIRGVEDMLRAVEAVDDVRLVIAGTGPAQELVEATARRCRRIQFMGQIPYEEVLARSCRADVLLALYDPAAPNNKHASPNKLFEAMMCGKPIIVSHGTSMTDIVREEKCGLSVPYGDIDLIRAAIQRLRDDKELRDTLGQNGRRAYEAKYSWSIMERRLMTAYTEVTHGVRQRSRTSGAQLCVCVVTFPFTEAFVTPLSNMVEALWCVAGDVCIITAGTEDVVIATNRFIRVHRILQRRASNALVRIAVHVYVQIRIAFALTVSAGKADVCVFFMEEGAFLPMLVARLFGKRVLWVLPSSLVEMTEHQKDPLFRVLAKLQGASYELSNRIVLYSERLIGQWHLVKYRDKISIAPRHFIDFDSFEIQTPLDDRPELVGYIGRLSREKGILNLLEAIPLVLEARAATRYLVGGDGQLRGEVEEHVDHLEDKLRFAGWIPHDELSGCLNQLKLLVLPSYTEGLPNIMLEAMACGTPVLAAPVGAIPDVIEDGETGFIMQDNSPECIADNIIRALSHPDLERIVRNARTLVEREFTFERAVERYRSVMASLK